MCGIAGFIRMDKAPAPKDWIEAMTGALAHRGPDARQTAAWGEAAFGHARLSIIDLATGAQPMSNEDGQVWITYNGELYNFKELRAELEKCGHAFRTHSDTEVIIHAYEQWGDACVERFRGMFAFGIADLRRRRLFLARDQLGIKPLYYYQDAGRFAFASELQAIRRLPEMKLTLDLAAMDQYLCLQYIPAPRTAFREARKLPPAHCLAVDFDGAHGEPEEYWRLEFHADEKPTEADWIERIDAALRESVKAHLVADVPFGAFLSGGVDSSAVVACMAQILDRPVRTFSIGFDESAYDETSYAAQAAALWRTEHHVERVRPQALEILPKLVQHYGEPFGDSSAIPTYYVSRMARRHVPMVLSGDGGDEAFGGYSTYAAWISWLERADTPPPRSRWRARLRPFARVAMPWRYPNARSLATAGAWLRFMGQIQFQPRRELWRPEFRRVCQRRMPLLEEEFRRVREAPPVSRAQYMDVKSYLPYSILAKVDVASMMHGLEVRTPIVDIRMMELAARIPSSYHLVRGADGEWITKSLFKKVVARYYPPEFLNRPKMGFTVPLQKWFAPKGELRGAAEDRLMGRGSLLHEFFERPAIGRILVAGGGTPIWLLLFLEEWLRQNRAGVSLGKASW